MAGLFEHKPAAAPAAFLNPRARAREREEGEGFHFGDFDLSIVEGVEGGRPWTVIVEVLEAREELTGNTEREKRGLGLVEEGMFTPSSQSSCGGRTLEIDEVAFLCTETR
jgi:hypothetical protein